jgi:AraC family transcriptional activator of pobA
MDKKASLGTFPAPMKTTVPLAVAFREVRHFQPDDAVHVEPLAVRGALHGWTIPAHRHEGLHQFMWLHSGGAQLTLDGLPHTLRAPAVLMVAPGCVHALRFQSDSAGLQVTVPSLRLQQGLAGAPALAAQLQPSRVLQGGAVPGAEARFLALAAEFNGDQPGRAEALQAQLLLLLVWLLRQGGAASADGGRAAVRDTLVRRYRALLDRHVRQHRPLAFYAQQLQVTPDHLSRSCRAVAGSSALDLLHDRLLHEARLLLAHTPAGVGQVARELGFADPAYFSRFFTRRAGLAPLAWRAALQQGRVGTP